MSEYPRMAVLVTMAGFGVAPQWLAWRTCLPAPGDTVVHDAPARPAAKLERIQAAVAES